MPAASAGQSISARYPLVSFCLARPSPYHVVTVESRERPYAIHELDERENRGDSSHSVIDGKEALQARLFMDVSNLRKGVAVTGSHRPRARSGGTVGADQRLVD
jgi:hypothetical protein